MFRSQIMQRQKVTVLKDIAHNGRAKLLPHTSLGGGAESPVLMESLARWSRKITPPVPYARRHGDQRRIF